MDNLLPEGVSSLEVQAQVISLWLHYGAQGRPLMLLYLLEFMSLPIGPEEWWADGGLGNPLAAVLNVSSLLSFSS